MNNLLSHNQILIPSARKYKKIQRQYLHRYIYEQYYNCCLLSWTDIHHKNDNPKDNRIENLIPLFHWDHSRITFTKDKSNRICYFCKVKGAKKYYKNFINEKGFICRNCYLLIRRIQNVNNGSRWKRKR